MEKRILVGFDGSERSMRAVDYVGFMFQNRKDIHLTILYLMNPLPALPKEQDISLRHKLHQQKERLEKERKERAGAAFKRAKEVLIRKNIPEDRFTVKAEFQKLGKARDLLNIAEKGNSFDAVVVGRRGLGAFTKMFAGSVSIELVRMQKEIPAVVVGNVIESKKVLIAMDDSENSLRAVDYASFILGNDPEVEFTLFSALPSLKTMLGEGISCEINELEKCYQSDEERQMNESFARAEKIFSDAGVEYARIKTKIKKKSFNIAKDIYEEAKRGGCGTVVLGRKGRTGLKGIVMGSVSLKSLALIEDRAVWIVG